MYYFLNSIILHQNKIQVGVHTYIKVYMLGVNQIFSIGVRLSKKKSKRSNMKKKIHSHCFNILD